MVKKYKARLVALGYGQVSGRDVFNTFALGVKSVTVRLLLAIAFIMNMHIHQLNVSNSFCYANIEGDVYMAPTPDFGSLFYVGEVTLYMDCVVHHGHGGSM